MISPVHALAFGLGFAAISPAAAQVGVGDLIVVDSRAGTNNRGSVFLVNSASGQRARISDFGDATQGPIGRAPVAATFDEHGLLVLDFGAGTDCTGTGFGCGALFRVNTTTGMRVLLSDFGNPAQGPTGLKPYDVTVDAAGQILVVDPASGDQGKLFVVDPADGTRTVLSNFANGAQGPLGGNPSGVAVEAGGRILVADAGIAVLFTVDPGTGQRSVLSDFHNIAQGPTGPVPIDVWPGSGGQIWVLEQAAFSPTGSGSGKIFRVEGTTGTRTVVSDLTTNAQGPIGLTANALEVTATGDVLFVDADQGTSARGAVTRVDPATGLRAYLSDFGNAAQGSLGVEPNGLVVFRGLTQQGAGGVLDTLHLAKGAGGDQVLTWGASCLPSDTDYAVYEGTIGAWSSHAAVQCSTGGATTTALTPQAADAYYLVVPRNAQFEGSYGTNSSGVPRPQGAGACAVQNAAPACP